MALKVALESSSGVFFLTPPTIEETEFAITRAVVITSSAQLKPIDLHLAPDFFLRALARATFLVDSLSV